MPGPTFAAKSLTDLIAIRAVNQPDSVAFYTGIDEPGNPLRSLTYSEVQQAVDRLCAHYASPSVLGPITPTPQRTIAILTSTALDESLLEIALSKLSLAPLLLSVNNSVPAVAHLCKITNATHLIYGAKFVEEAKEVQEILGGDFGIVPDTRFPLWGPEGISDGKPIPSYPALLTPEQEAPRVAVILHSSGSTGFPKPVYVTHKGLIANLHGHVPKPGFSALPVYHGFGHFSVFRCYYNAFPFTLFPPHLPLTSKNICEIIRKSPTRCTQCFAVPYVIKLLAETEEGTKSLADFEAVSYAGAALPDDLGDRLTSSGVNLISIYGTTETGALLTSKRDFGTDKAWNWLRAGGVVGEYMSMEGRGVQVDTTGTQTEIYELIVHDGYPPKIETNRPDGSYATKDLFIRHPDSKLHPERAGWYKYCGRLDDTLVLVLGEKTNPVPIELAIRGNSPYVAEAIIFGAGRPQVGCLVLPSEAGRVALEDKGFEAGPELTSEAKKYFIELIWPVIEEANAQAPTHSRVLMEMVDVLPYGTHIPIATKMTILRPACYAKFKDLIDSIYTRFENGPSSQTKQALTTLPSLESFLTQVIATTLGPNKTKGLGRESDLFAFGVDSLQATRIRNVCVKELELGGGVLGGNVVYENPSIEKLAKYILALSTGNGEVVKTDEEQYATMLGMVEKWSAKFDVKSVGTVGSETGIGNGIQRPGGRVVVLTGATGSLGAHILQHLVSSPTVTKVICLSRAASHPDSLVRVKESLKQRQRVLSEADMAKVVSFAVNVNEDGLGLKRDEYEGVLREVTDVVHNAWPVNFVLGIDSYDEHIGGSVNLINLCIRSSHTASFYFSSSVGTRQGRPDPVVEESFSTSPETAAPMGYARSKWVMEGLCERAARDRNVSVGVLRIGQVVGDTENGVWNETEAWPLMFKSANTTGALPRLTEKPSWIPVNIAGRAIVEIVTQPRPPKAAVYHVMNPSLSSWDTILSGLQKAGVEFKAVERTEWLDRLAQSNPDGVVNPSIKLLGFYRNRIGKTNERPPQDFRIDLTGRVAPSIANCPPVSEELVGRWVQHWREAGFMTK